jgi:sugar-specific transcriptional regulator TrmB
MDKKEIIKILEDIGMPPAEISVYISLLDGSQSVQEIMKVTNEKRPTVYYSLNSLEKRGLVSKTGKEYGNKFQIESIDTLLELVNKNIRKQNILLDKIKKLKQFYTKNKNNEKASVSYFDNLEAIKTAVFYSLYGKGKTIRTIVPADNFFHQMGKDFIEEYVNEKNKRGMKTRALWEDIPSKNIIKNYYSGSEIKQMPVEMHNNFETTIFVYDDKTLYLGSKKENHAILIQSKDHAKMMNALFENVWLNGIEIFTK